MPLDDLDLNTASALIEKKGGGKCPVYFGQKAIRDLGRLAARPTDASKRPLAPVVVRRPRRYDRFTRYQVVQARGEQAGLDRRVFAHLFRHTVAHLFKIAGGSEEAL